MKTTKTKRLTKRSLKDLKGGLRAAGTTTCSCDSITYCLRGATANISAQKVGSQPKAELVAPKVDSVKGH